MMERRRLVATLASLLPIAGGCNAILGIESHSQTAAASQIDGGGAGMASVCRLDGAVEDAEGTTVAEGTACGFTMPNPARAGLPNPAKYTEKMLDGVAVVVDDVTGLTWQADVAYTTYRQRDAIKTCADLGGGWRLPTRIELVSLVDFTVGKPGPTINPIFPKTPSAIFWSSSHAACDTGTGWAVGFDDGSTHQQKETTNTFKIRCVLGARAASACSPARYQPQAEGSVRDTATGLTWQRATSVKTMVWSDAKTYCRNLGKDWRLPSLTELQTIVEDTKEVPPVDVVAFPNTPRDGVFWTSSPQAGVADSAWYVTSVHGHADVQATTDGGWVRCVR
jgi:hypothetical protein